MHLNDDRQLTGAFTLEANFRGFLQVTTETIRNMHMFLEWADKSRECWVAEAIPEPVELSYVRSLDRLTELAVRTTRFLRIIFERPEKRIIVRRDSREETTKPAESAEEVRQRINFEIMNGTFSSALAEYNALSPTSKLAVELDLDDLRKTSLKFLGKLRRPGLAEEQFQEAMRALRIVSASNSRRQSLDQPTTPTDTAPILDSEATPSSRHIVRRKGVWYELSPSSTAIAGTYRKISKPIEGVPWSNVDEMLDDQDHSSSPSPTDRVMSKRRALPSPQLEDKDKRPVSVLIVDDMNGDRSSWTHAYLEQVRVSMFSSLRQWPFDCVESAGLCISTPFSKPYLAKAKLARGLGRPISDRVVDMVFGDLSAHLTQVKSREEPKVRAWLAQHKPKGVVTDHFRDCDYILCFDKEHHKVLRDMQEFVRTSANSGSPRAKDTSQSCQVVLLTSLTTDHALASSSKNTGMSTNPTFTWQTMLRMHVVESFFKRKLGWYGSGWDAHAGIGPLASEHLGIEWGTQQFTLPDGYRLIKPSGFWDGRLWTLEQQTDCVVHVGCLSMVEVAWICGPRVNHEKAEGMLRDWIEEDVASMSDEDE